MSPGYTLNNENSSSINDSHYVDNAILRILNCLSLLWSMQNSLVFILVGRALCFNLCNNARLTPLQSIITTSRSNTVQVHLSDVTKVANFNFILSRSIISKSTKIYITTHSAVRILKCIYHFIINNCKRVISDVNFSLRKFRQLAAFSPFKGNRFHCIPMDTRLMWQRYTY